MEIETEEVKQYYLVSFIDDGEPDITGHFKRTMITTCDFDVGSSSDSWYTKHTYTKLSFGDGKMTDVSPNRIGSIQKLTDEEYYQTTDCHCHLIV